MAQEPTVFLVDDDKDLCKSIHFLGESVGLNVEYFCRARSFLEQYNDARPGCLLLDIRMPEMSGLQLQAELKARNINIPIIFMTGHGDISMAVQAVKEGAYQFFSKPCNSQALLDCLHQAIREDLELRKRNKRRLEVQIRVQRLTPRENEIMEYVIAGMTSKVIAEKLGISIKTVDLHRNRLMEKMEVSSSVELAVLLLKHRDQTQVFIGA